LSLPTITDIEEAHRLLLERFGETKKPPREGGTTGALVAGLLSQNTTDKNRDAAYAELRKQYPLWESVAAAPEMALADAIRVAGMMHQRSFRIKALLKAIFDKTGTYSADFLLTIPHNEAFEWLVRRDGIGEKTAAVFLLFSAGAPYFPVDTHIKRIMPRLGWFPEKTTAIKIQRKMTEICPRKIMKTFHLNLLKLGRIICRPRKPECAKCPLVKKCAYPEFEPVKV